MLKNINEFFESYSRERLEAMVNMDQLALAEQIWDEIGSTGKLRDAISAMQTYATIRNKALESKLSTLEETIKAADEVIQATKPFGELSSPKNPYWKALEKYNSLKLKTP